MTALDAQIRATAMVSYKAVIDHAVEHGLAAPESLDLSNDGIRVWLTCEPEQSEAWVESIHVTDTTLNPSTVQGFERVNVSGHLPGLLGQVKVELRFSRLAATPTPLQAVGS